MKISPTSLFTWAISLAALGTIAISLSLIDSPTQARLRKLDEQRVADLQKLSMNISYYHKAHDKLPEHLEQLNQSPKDLKDVVTGQPYGYKIYDADAYELCAVFDTTPNNDAQRPFNLYGTCSIPWERHTQGKHCFTISTKGCK